MINKLKLFFKLAKYFEKKYYCGRGIRWMITDDTGKTVSCTCCGNIANGSLRIKVFGSTFNLPFCKSHIAIILEKDRPENDGFILPQVIDVNDSKLVTERML